MNSQIPGGIDFYRDQRQGTMQDCQSQNRQGDRGSCSSRRAVSLTTILKQAVLKQAVLKQAVLKQAVLKQTVLKRSFLKQAFFQC